MTKQEFLDLPETWERIQQETLRIEAMRARLTSPKGLDTRDKVQSSGGNNDLAETVIDLQQQLDKELDDFRALTAEAGDMIRQYLTADTALVMRLRYVNCCSWGEISAMTGCSPSSLYRHRADALEILFDRAGEVYRK